MVRLLIAASVVLAGASSAAAGPSLASVSAGWPGSGGQSVARSGVPFPLRAVVQVDAASESSGCRLVVQTRDPAGIPCRTVFPLPELAAGRHMVPLVARHTGSWLQPLRVALERAYADAECSPADVELIEAHATGLSVAEPMAKAFETKYPGIKVAVERSGAERVFQRIGQEMASKIYRVDVANSSDAAHFIVWKREGWLAPFVSQDMARDLATEMIDADGAFCNQRTHLSTIAYNSKMIAPADAPRGFMDLLDPKYSGKLVKGHPGYSGTIMTATQQLARELGWSYFEKLAKQKVLQVQSATEPPKRIVAGERAIAVDGSDYLFWVAKK